MLVLAIQNCVIFEWKHRFKILWSKLLQMVQDFLKLLWKLKVSPSNVHVFYISLKTFSFCHACIVWHNKTHYSGWNFLKKFFVDWGMFATHEYFFYLTEHFFAIFIQLLFSVHATQSVLLLFIKVKKEKKNWNRNFLPLLL